MPRFIVTTKLMMQTNGIRMEPGVSVEAVTTEYANPLLYNGGKLVADAFLRIYNVDLKKADVLAQPGIPGWATSRIIIIIKPVGCNLRED